MKSIEISKAAVFNELSEIILGDKPKVLAKLISELYNLLILHEIFPKCLQSCETKIDSVKPETETDPSSKRAISLIPIIYKKIGKVIHDQANLLYGEIYWFTYLLFDTQLVIEKKIIKKQQIQ